MKLFELIEDLTWEEVKEALLKNYPEHAEKYIDGYEEVYFKLNTMEPAESDMRICIEWVEPDGELVEEGYWDVCGKNGSLQKDQEDFKYFRKSHDEAFANSEVSYGIEFSKWNQWLAMEIDENTANNFNLMKSDIIAHCLYELTFISYEEEEIQGKLDELKEQVEKIDNMTEEEIKENFISIDELKKSLEDEDEEKDN